MEPNLALVAICKSHVESDVRKEIGLEAKIKTAFRLVQHFWLTTDMDVRWNGALAAVMLDPAITAEERETLVRSAKTMVAVSLAMRGGSQTNLADIVAEAEREEILPLRGWWLEAEAIAAESEPSADEVEQLVKDLSPRLAGKEPPVQGAALANLLAIWLAGHVTHNDSMIDREATAKLREEILELHITKVLELLVVEARRMGTA